jgi:hypothetical protein
MQRNRLEVGPPYKVTSMFPRICRARNLEGTQKMEDYNPQPEGVLENSSTLVEHEFRHKL